jgi:hypothetical protein
MFTNPLPLYIFVDTFCGEMQPCGVSVWVLNEVEIPLPCLLLSIRRSNRAAQAHPGKKFRLRGCRTQGSDVASSQEDPTRTSVAF